MMQTNGRVVGVAKLAKYLKSLLEDNTDLRDVGVEGEISNPRMSGAHWYFDLKEEAAVLPCTIFDAARIRDLPPIRSGQKIIAFGKFSTYAAKGQYQLRVQALRLTGEGELYAAFEELRRKFEAEGIFAATRKRALPSFPFRIAVVSSAQADGYKDFCTIIARRSPHITLVHVATVVQGKDAPGDISAAIARAQSLHVDIVAVVRGGGSFEDRFAFSHELVVRAVVASRVPVLTGIGHESDMSLADFAADKAASTPSDAAHTLIARDDIMALLARRLAELDRRYDAAQGRRRRKLAELSHRLERVNPAAKLSERTKRLTKASDRLENAKVRVFDQRKRALTKLAERTDRALRAGLDRRRIALRLTEAKIGAFDPTHILRLGYAIVRNEGRVLMNAMDIAIGDTIEASLARGRFVARVESTGYDG